ncbi:hypothetical protein HN385_03255 [archaeon]|jgi:hypothetical protein|nr:hypothetical protein [archaeon]MBT3450406.1 hypothetical protein [archaeon]MBT6868498.1 hypothetical protein [archaeon]MBT7380062.1 hypothetical protein [archaeon]MBT7508279.1 hypothetical protein [archaeon]
MKVIIPIPKPDESIKANLIRLNIFLKELGWLKESLDNRINEVVKEQQDIFVNTSKPDFFYNNLSGELTDMKINLFVKSFFFIAKQSIDKIFRIIYQIRDEIKIDNGEYNLPDVSNSGRLKKFIENLIEGKYDHYNSELIFLLKEKRDLFIVSRCIRNQLKYFGNFLVFNVNNKIDIIIQLGENYFHKEPIIKYLSNAEDIDYSHLSNFTLNNNSLNQTINDIASFYNLLTKIITDLN